MKIGILGGTFDPVHNGHIRLAEGAREELGLDKVIFVPAHIPPHKPGREITPWQDRFRMIELAIEGRAGLEASDVESKLKGASYSINTIKEFRKSYGDAAEFFFITGADSAGELDSWKDIEALKRLCRFVIATRPGYDASRPPADTTHINVDTPDISSTGIRAAAAAGGDIKAQVPLNVYNYIIIRKLYKT